MVTSVTNVVFVPEEKAEREGFSGQFVKVPSITALPEVPSSMSPNAFTAAIVATLTPSFSAIPKPIPPGLLLSRLCH